MDQVNEPVVLQVCEHCAGTYPEGSVCPCEEERRRNELLEEKMNRSKRYCFHAAAERRRTNADVNLHEKLLEVLNNRGIQDMETFLGCPIGGLLEDAFLNQDLAVARLKEAVLSGEQITVYGDYDVDGVTSVALGLNILRSLGAKVDYYINDRFDEGFGIGVQGVEEIARRGGSLILTADNGITGVEAVRRARALGLSVVVTDHHEPNQELPDCIVVDPKQPGCTYPNKEIVGVGVLFKVLDALLVELGYGRRAMHELDLVALGTVADVAPLLGENRILVKNGLKLMDPAMMKGKRSVRPGILALREAAGLNNAPVSAYHLGFLFGPMINAEGRLNGVPDMAVELLVTRDPVRARSLAMKLKEINEKRKKKVEDLYELALSQVDPTKKLLVMAHPSFEEGVVGLLAGRLKKDFYLPAIVLGLDKDGHYKGSGRSIEGFNLKKELDKLSGLLLKYGGHEQACGLSVASENLDVVRNMLETQAALQIPDGHQECVFVDVELRASDIGAGLLDDLVRLEPFGQGFPRPRFLLRQFKPDALGYSRDGKHTRMQACVQGESVDFWLFGQTLSRETESLDLIGCPCYNEFRGKRSIQFRIEEWGARLPIDEREDE